MVKHINTLIFLVCAVATFAQAPKKFNYQAVARNAQGTVLPNQAVKIRASILDGSANGTSQYSEIHSVTTTQLGLFNLAIGGGTVVNGKFSNITWASNNKYLKIEMDATGGNNFTLVGTNQLLSVPYALNAENGSQFIDLGNNVGIAYDTTYGESVRIGTLDDTRVWRVVIKGIDVENPDPNYFYNGYSKLLGFYDQGNQLRWHVNFNEHKDIEFVETGKNDAVFVLGVGGNVGIGKNGMPHQFTPRSKLHIQSGDIYLEDATKGVIMKSPNGQCWRMTVSNAGLPQFSSVTCP